MPITSSAKRALKKSARQRKTNWQKRTVLKKAKKNIIKLWQNGQKDEAARALPQTYRLLDKAAKVHLIKKTKAAREKSKLAKKIIS